MLLARPPRYSPEGFHVRLACLIHAANVRSEPGSNPSLYVCSEHCCSSQGSTWLFVAKPQPHTKFPRTSPQVADASYGRLPTRSANHLPPKCHAALLRIGLIKKLTRFFFRGHPECQRSSPESEFGSQLGAGNVSELVDLAQASAQGFFRICARRCQRRV